MFFSKHTHLKDLFQDSDLIPVTVFFKPWPIFSAINQRSELTDQTIVTFNSSK